jgi:hypothetical protein
MMKMTMRLALAATLALLGSACGNDSAEEIPGLSAGGAGAAGNVAPAAGSGGAGSSAAGAAAAGRMAVGMAGAAAGSTAAGSGGSGTAGSVAGSGGAAGTSSGAGGSAAGESGGQAGAAGAAGAAGGSAEAGAGGSAAVVVKPPCLEKPSQVVVPGDSYLNWITHTFPDDLTREAGMQFRMLAVGGASMASGGIAGLIPDQLTSALAMDPDAIAAVMSGGGNDILIADAIKYPGADRCKDVLDSPMMKVCQDVIAGALGAARKLMVDASEAGIRDTIYVFYPHIPGGGFGGMNPNAILDYSSPMAKKLCEDAEMVTSGKMRCHFLDLVPVFEGHADWFADDGIHENSLGSAQMAKEVVKIMKDKCIAQPASSGCCTP